MNLAARPGAGTANGSPAIAIDVPVFVRAIQLPWNEYVRVVGFIPASVGSAFELYW